MIDVIELGVDSEMIYVFLRQTLIVQLYSHFEIK